MGSLGQKATRLIGAAVVGIFIFTSSAMAITLDVVGSVDDFLGACNGLPSGDATEIACVEGFSGPGTVTALQKFTQSPSSGELPLVLEAVDGQANTYSLALPEAWQGAYFILKSGNLTPGPGGPTVYSYVFRNLSSLAYAVFNINDPGFPVSYDGNIGKLSHISVVQVLPTPLPAAVWMFMAAIGGLFGFRKVGARHRR